MRGVRISSRVPLELLLVEATLRIAAAKIATADFPCEIPALFSALARDRAFAAIVTNAAAPGAFV